MTIEEADAIKKNFNDTQGSVNRLKPLGLTGQSQIEAVDLLNKKRELQKTIDTAKEKAVVQEEIDQIEGSCRRKKINWSSKNWLGT